jgi:hypothetical protein
MNFATLAEVKSMFDPPLTDTTFDAALEIYMAAVGAEFDTYCNRPFEQGEHTEIVNGGEADVFLRATPVDIIVAVWADANQVFEDDDQLVEDDDFVLADADGGRVFGPFTGWGRNEIKVQYVGGYAPPEDADDEPPVPADLKLAFIRQVVHDFKRRKDVGLQNIAFKDGSISKTTTSMLLPVVTEVLDRYRVMNV